MPSRYILQKDGVTQIQDNGTNLFDNLDQIETYLGYKEYLINQ